MVASRSAAEASATVAHRFPDSRETVENNAALKASTSPTSARKNRTQTSGSSRGNTRRRREKLAPRAPGFAESCIGGSRLFREEHCPAGVSIRITLPKAEAQHRRSFHCWLIGHAA